MADKTLTCRDCGNEFVFTEGEQEFYKEKGFENEPTRCPACRKALIDRGIKKIYYTGNNSFIYETI